MGLVMQTLNTDTQEAESVRAEGHGLLGYRVSSKPAWTASETLSQNKENWNICFSLFTLIYVGLNQGLT